MKLGCRELKRKNAFDLREVAGFLNTHLAKDSAGARNQLR